MGALCGRQHLAQVASGPIEPGHHRADRDAKGLGGFAIRKAFDVGEHDHRAMLDGKAFEGTDQLGRPPGVGGR